jgi:hypothetical protein
LVGRDGAGEEGLDAVEPAVQVGHVLVRSLADEITGYRRRQHADQADAGEHEDDRHAPAARGDRVLVAVAHRGHGDDGPPQRVAEIVDVGAGRVLLEGELDRRADPDDGQHRQQHEVQAVVGEQLPGPLQRAGQDQPGPAERDQAQQPQQSQRAQRPQHRHGDDRQVDQVTPEELPARRRQVQLDQVLHHEDGPDQVVDAVQHVAGPRRDPDHKRHHENGKPEHREHRQRNLDRIGEPIVGILRFHPSSPALFPDIVDIYRPCSGG